MEGLVEKQVALTDLGASLGSESINISSPNRTQEIMSAEQSRASLNTLFHECKLLIKKEMIKRRW